ncbi:pentapeptide repeat-containing protein [Nocardia barduliensis]|uniref:pentapeptide repeat-containing protein n=1 Tax=Nocardia barduliensis TaxID=2736643 RepID=UPI0015722FB8|nr:pentapeptide repeat-containing protein [Nocardia barduliensis]
MARTRRDKTTLSAFGHRAGRIGLFAAVGYALVGGLVVAGVAYGFLRLIMPIDRGRAAAEIEVTRVALTVVAGVGGVVALVIAYRRQRDLEQSKFVERFGAAAAQLGATDVAVRIAGVYAMAGVADETDGPRRQQCIDVLCGYLRLPYSPELGGNHQTKDIRKYPAVEPSGFENEQHFEYRQNDREVRRTIVRVIADHLLPGTEYAWSPYNLDFRTSRLEAADFDNVTFSGTARFDNATFVGGARFGGATFTGTASFHQANFSGDSWFHKAAFTSATSFGEAIFSGDASFGEASFSGDTTFGDATFSGETSFGEATFSSDISFDGATFGNDTLFRGATFTGTTSFRSVTFTGDAWFHGASFDNNSWTWFHEAIFARTAVFGGAIFTGDARLDRVTFTGNAWFQGATFSRESSFHEATFTRNASFSAARFTGAAWFYGAAFTGDTSFDKAAFDNEALFRGVTFTETASFRNAAFGGPAWFHGATFTGNASFAQVLFQGRTSFALVDFGTGQILFTEPRQWGPPLPEFDWSEGGEGKPENVEPVEWPPAVATA